MDFEVTKMGERGQVVIPLAFRKAMGLQVGDKFIVVEGTDMLILKRMQKPTMNEFEGLMKKAHEHAKRHQLTKKDMDDAIRKARS